MTKPYKILPLKDAFADYPGGAKAFLAEHGDFVSKPKDAFVVLVADDFYSDLDGGHDYEGMFGEALDFEYENDKTICAILFKKNCSIPNMCFIDYDSDYAPSLIVQGNLTARALSLSGGRTQIAGDCNVREVIYGFYNHGELVVNGSTNAPLMIADDYSMQLNGAVNAQYIMGDAWKTLAPYSNVPVWDVSENTKQIKAAIDPFFMDANGFDGDLMHRAVMLGDCLLKDKPANAKKRKKSDYYQLSDSVKAKLSAYQAQTSPVTALNLSGHHMGEFPAQFRQFKYAQNIHLSNNGIKALPSWMNEFDDLQHLYLSSNEIKKLPLNPAQFAQLKTLHIDDTQVFSIDDGKSQLNHLTELKFGKKDWGNGGETVGRMAIDFDWQRAPNLQHLHIAETGWWWDWHGDFGFYQCKQLQYLHFGYQAHGAMGKHLSQLQALEFYGYETDWNGEDAAVGEIDVDTLASLPNLTVLYITKDAQGLDKNMVQTLRQRLPNLYISAPYADCGFAQDAKFKKLNESFEKVRNYQPYEPKNDDPKNDNLVAQMLSLVQEHRLEISPKWLTTTWENILKYLEQKAVNCEDMTLKKSYIQQLFDAAQLVKPYIPKPASWTHLMLYGYDLWELVYASEIWHALRRQDHNASHLKWAFEQLAICLPIEQKQQHRQEFAGLYELAIALQQA